MQPQRIIQEIEKLPIAQRLYIIENTLRNIRQAKSGSELSEGARALLKDYQEDKDLTAFTNLDSEDFS